jgi:hypothetical protein
MPQRRPRRASQPRGPAESASPRREPGFPIEFFSEEHRRATAEGATRAAASDDDVYPASSGLNASLQSAGATGYLLEEHRRMTAEGATRAAASDDEEHPASSGLNASLQSGGAMSSLVEEHRRMIAEIEGQAGGARRGDPDR